MIIDIDDKLFCKIKTILKKRNITTYNILCNIKPINTSYNDILEKARVIKTINKKAEIKKAIKEMIHSKIQPTKYKIKMKTSISYATLNKYYDEIFDEVLKEIKS